MTLVGNLSGGGTLTATFAGIATATLETINWANLTSVTFTATNDAALDDIALNQVPEPASLLLVGTGLVAARRRFAQRAYGPPGRSKLASPASVHLAVIQE
jgi:hypothetical protein